MIDDSKDVSGGLSNEDGDELYNEALNVVKSEGKASTVFYKENYKLGTIELQEL